MSRVLFELEIGDVLLSVGSYRFFGFLSALIFLFVLLKTLNKNKIGVTASIFSALLVATSFLVGSRLLYSLLFIDKVIENPSILFATRYINFSLFGGLGLSTLVIWLVTRWKGLSFFKITDSLIPYAAFSLILFRVGCFLNGCCFGKTTNVAWGVTFPEGSLAHRAQLLSNPFSVLSPVQSVHPTQIYEIVGVAFAIVIGWIVMKRYKISGLYTASFVALYAAVRLILYFFRHYPEGITWVQSLQAPVMYGLVIMASCLTIYLLKKRG